MSDPAPWPQGQFCNVWTDKPGPHMQCLHCGEVIPAREFVIHGCAATVEPSHALLVSKVIKDGDGKFHAVIKNDWGQPMSELEKVQKEAARQANRLHHLGMRYIGAVMELAQGKPTDLVPVGTPGAHEVRDLICLVLLTRAEINAITNLMVKAGLLKPEAVIREFAEQYQWFCDTKAEHLGVKVTDFGLEILVPNSGEPQDG